MTQDDIDNRRQTLVLAPCKYNMEDVNEEYIDFTPRLELPSLQVTLAANTSQVGAVEEAGTLLGIIKGLAGTGAASGLGVAAFEFNVSCF